MTQKKTPPRTPPKRPERWAEVRSGWPIFLAAALTAVFLLWMFWWPLCNGGGLIGGDLYPYYFPQKVWFSESLARGETPLWNPLVGFGYPVLGESQTAAYYPPNQLLFRIASVNQAFHWSQLGHYLLAFAGMVALSLRLGLKGPGALLAATAFIYGWFPARICLEWAIIGGAWYVWILWAYVAFLQTGRRRYWGLLGLFLGLDLLAGHYNLAFITLLTMIPLTWLVPRIASQQDDTSENRNVPRTDWRRVFFSGVAVVCGFLVSGVQLLQSWELKSVSQRQEVNDVFAPTYGHLPPVAISQLWMPWAWYAGEKSFDELLSSRFLSVPMATNQAEAQLYVGLIPFLLALLGLLIPSWRRSLSIRNPWGWPALIAVSLIFATGWPTVFLSNVPGFGFFRGPGRYSMTAAFAIAILAGACLDQLTRRWSLRSIEMTLLTGLLLGVTACDLWAASRQYQFHFGPFFGRQVFYATLLDDPPINHLHESPLRKYFTEQGGNTRLYAPGQNIPSMLNVSAIPVYLGLGPEIYESDEIRVDFSQTDPAAIQNAVSRLRRFGVTHLLLEQPLEPDQWPVESLGGVIDPFLNRALARQEPFYFYKLLDSPGRASFISGSGEIHSIEDTGHSVSIQLTSPSGGTLQLRDLNYPGWQPASTGGKAETECDQLFRCVEVQGSPERQTITWNYRPRSWYWGSFASLLGLVLLTAGWLWRPRSAHIAIT